jgi:chemotaxis signal transduction protein
MAGPEASIVSAADLKRGFDRAFSQAPATLADAQDDLLAVEIGGDPYAIRLPEVAGLVSDGSVMPLPGSVPAMLGLMAIRGDLVPAYDLRILLDYPRGAPSRWLLIAAGTRVALAVDRFEGHLRVARGRVSPGATAHASSRSSYFREVVRTGERTRPVIHVASVLDQIVLAAHQRPREQGNHP